MNDNNNNNNNNIHGNINQQMPFFGDDFSLQDIVDHSLNFDHVINMIRGDTSNPLAIGVNEHNFDQHMFTNNVQENQHYGQICQPAPDDVFNSFNSPTISCANNSLLNSLSGIDNDMINEGNEDDDEDDGVDAEHSSAKNGGKKGKVDRSRTLISERRRRGRMKEKLYALRALVPNITKMDKASIVGDAVLYLQDMQMQAKKLQAEIQDLESSYETATRCQVFVDTPIKNVPLHIPVCKIIMQVDVIQIEDKEFYVKIVSNKGQGVAACHYKALESLRGFIKSSNLTSLCEEFVLTFTINVGKTMDNFDLPNLKLWITGAFMNQGFELRTF